MIPRVYFYFGDLWWDIWLVERFNKMKKYVLYKQLVKKYPIVKKLKNTEKDREKLRLFFINEYKKHFKEIADSVAHFQKVWEKKNDKFMHALCCVLQVKPPKNRVIKGYISINPICPRDWKGWSFCITYTMLDSGKIRTTAHEITHMFYFKKLIDEFPKINTKMFNEHGREWRLSEVLAPIIMNDPRIVKVIGKTPLHTYACGDDILLKFDELYKEHLKKKTSFVTFYKKARKLADKLL
jgi:hemoglobin-like flavoprotein